MQVALSCIAATLLALTGLVSMVPVAEGQANRIAPADVTRPKGTKPYTGDAAKLLAVGTTRHGDTSLSTVKGRSCNTCHLEADSYNATFKRPWPHFVASVKTKTGLDRITAEGIVQFCMISAMEARPLAWDSEALAGLTAFVLERHKKVVRK
jgi:cytochrome c peroxidase